MLLEAVFRHQKFWDKLRVVVTVWVWVTVGKVWVTLDRVGAELSFFCVHPVNYKHGPGVSRKLEFVTFYIIKTQGLLITYATYNV